MSLRVLLATLIAAACLTGSAVAVAQTADDEAAERARIAKAIADAFGEECSIGCTAGIRAQERIADGRAG